MSRPRSSIRFNKWSDRIEELRSRLVITDGDYQELMSQAHRVYTGLSIVAGELETSPSELFGYTRNYLECRSERHQFPRATRVLAFKVAKEAGKTFWAEETCSHCTMVRYRERFRANLRKVPGSHPSYKPPQGYSFGGHARMFSPSDADSALIAFEFEDHILALEQMHLPKNAQMLRPSAG